MRVWCVQWSRIKDLLEKTHACEERAHQARSDCRLDLRRGSHQACLWAMS